MIRGRALTSNEMTWIDQTIRNLPAMTPTKRSEARAETIRLVAIGIAHAARGWSFANPGNREDLTMAAIVGTIEELDRTIADPTRSARVSSWPARLIRAARYIAERETVNEQLVSGGTVHQVRKSTRQRREVAAARRTLGDGATDEQIAKQVRAQLKKSYARPEKSGFMVEPADVRKVEAGLHL